MANPRPNFIDLRTDSQASVSRPLRSPRLHVAGEAPPELSPLDAFALQSRLLARQLKQQANESGKRVSRLPPLTTESPLIVQGRSDYFRSMSGDSSSEYGESPLQASMGLGLRTEIEDDIPNRPMSMHPRMSRIPPTPDESFPLPTTPHADSLRGRPLNHITEDKGVYGARREQSPSSLDGSVPAEARPLQSRSNTQDSITQASSVHSHPLTGSPEKIVKVNSFDSSGGLVPPRPLFPKRSSSILSSPLEGADEEGFNSLSASFYSQPPRKLSTTSNLASPSFGHAQRSPSVSSDASGLPRPSFNFSRPLSRAGTPSFDTPARQASSDSHSSFVLADDTANTPISMSSEGFPDSLSEDAKAGAPSYIYSKYSLPRGKVLQRSVPFGDGQAPASFQWQQPPFAPPSNVQTFPVTGQAPPSPPSRPSSSAGSRLFEEPIARPSLERSKLSMEVLRDDRDRQAMQRPSTGGSEKPSVDELRGRPLTSPIHDSVRGRTPMSAATSDSASTIKAEKSIHSMASAVEIPAEEHLAKAIALHESGSLNESTYHLRHAAKQNHPTGMLLYALACRHGWGMRPNQREGVQWLRRAAESASLEIADEEDQAKEGKSVDISERKTRKAQFALSIYELGVSHMNGWGIEQDKALALRCFEIAGSWGDIDALAEAGFCYAKGIGCKKDLKKSANFYRQAEAKGMSMIGNSWIHKSKYNDDEKDAKSDKKARSKSRSRNVFGLKSKS